MRPLQKHPPLNQSGSTRANVIIAIAGTIAVSVWLLIGQKPAQKAEENRSRSQNALKAAGFGDVAERVYGKNSK